MRFILTATRKSDKARLHLLNRNTSYCEWVIYWNYSTTHNSWDWGTYCDSLKYALSVFSAKCEEHDFTKVYEGYIEIEGDI